MIRVRIYFDGMDFSMVELCIIDIEMHIDARSSFVEFGWWQNGSMKNIEYSREAERDLQYIYWIL